MKWYCRELGEDSELNYFRKIIQKHLEILFQAIFPVDFFTHKKKKNHSHCDGLTV